MMNTVAMSIGWPVAPSTAPMIATGSTLTNMAIAARRQLRSERKKVAKQAEGHGRDAGDLAA